MVLERIIDYYSVFEGEVSSRTETYAKELINRKRYSRLGL